MALIFSRLGFWLAWLLIPILFEFLPTCSYFFRLRFSKKAPTTKTLSYLPYITVIIPVYNSEKTLYKCLASLDSSTYPNSSMQIILANNHSTDQSFAVFDRARHTFTSLNLHWLETDPGKARALNAAIYNARGKYILNIDSDGFLEQNALLNIVTRFENDPQTLALTGTILINKELIKQTKKWGLRFLQANEYFEYTRAFLTGRQIESAKNQLFTLSGAFSAFRKETLFQTFLYNPQTVGEDTEITFQIRTRLKGKIALCPDAIFYAEPIESLGALYLQRQRWQRGQIETAQAFMRETAGLKTFFRNFMIRKMMIDHTFIFCRIIWVFGLLVLVYLGYSPLLLACSLGLLYLLYIFNENLNLLIALRFLKKFPKERAYLRHKAWCCLTIPLYNLLCALIRLLGIINSITHPAKWRAERFSHEWSQIKTIVKEDLKHLQQRKDHHE